jgi:hypothetical protein
MSKRIAAAVAAVALALVGLAMPPASAAAVAPLTHTARIAGNLDVGGHGYWARLSYSRTVRIVEAGEGQWAVTLTDRGSFTTMPGFRSPGAGATIRRAQPGDFAGTYNFTVASETAPTAAAVRRFYNFRCNPAVPGRGDCAGMPATTSDWPKLYFGEGAQVTAGSWRWDYRTCAERWSNSSAGDSGDITGKRCAVPVTPAAPTVAQPACDETMGTVTVPGVRGVYYTVGRGRVLRAGERDLAPGTYVVTAHAKPGFVLARGVDRRWTLVINEPGACPTPTPTPTVTETVTPTPTPTVQVVTPEAPTVTQATCEVSARIVVPSVAGVVYKNASGDVREPGSYTASQGSYTLTAEAAEGFTLAEGVDTSWTLTVDAAPDCPSPTPTVTQTTVTVINDIPIPVRVDTGLGGLAA